MEVIVGLITGLLAKYPAAAAVIAVVGVCRIVIKGGIVLFKEIAAYTSSTKDDEIVAKVEASGFYKWTLIVLDYLFSIKLPGAPSSTK